MHSFGKFAQVLVPGTVQDTMDTKPGQAYALSTDSKGAE